MNRRGFIRITSVAALPILMGIFPRRQNEDKEYSITVDSNRAFGHKLREHQQTAPTLFSETDYVIVGGGIAGLAAALELKKHNFKLFEGGKMLGGSSGSGNWKSVRFATGAHYELAYPTNYGPDALKKLEEIGIIYFNSIADLYQFVDREFVIPEKKAEQCFVENAVFPEVLDGVEGIPAFNDLMLSFSGEMPLPTRLINPKFHYLNKISFAEFLKKQIDLNPNLKRRIDYQMLDDWGAKSDGVSALAGIHYYTCRPYFEQDVELFSPPNGNHYFIEKMVGQLDTVDSIHTACMVRKIKPVENGVEVEVLHENGSVERVKAKGVVYAAQKHALPCILQTDKPLFNNDYAPWVVLNIVCKKGVDFGKWQNDVVTDKMEFLGFVDSNHQKNRSDDFEVFTAYYCFDKDSRKQLVEIEQDPKNFIEQTIQLIQDETNTTFEDLIQHVNLKVMGHAMPIAKPGYLSLSDVPEYQDNIIFAGVDTGRLPLFFEAFDSGLQAANKLLKNLEKGEGGTL